MLEELSPVFFLFLKIQGWPGDVNQYRALVYQDKHSPDPIPSSTRNKKGSQAPVIGVHLAFPSSHMEQEEYKVDSLNGEPRTGSVQLSS